jgi:hypothetical protein
VALGQQAVGVDGHDLDAEPLAELDLARARPRRDVPANLAAGQPRLERRAQMAERGWRGTGDDRIAAVEERVDREALLVEEREEAALATAHVIRVVVGHEHVIEMAPAEQPFEIPGHAARVPEPAVVTQINEQGAAPEDDHLRIVLTDVEDADGQAGAGGRARPGRGGP